MTDSSLFTMSGMKSSGKQLVQWCFNVSTATESCTFEIVWNMRVMVLHLKGLRMKTCFFSTVRTSKKEIQLEFVL